MVFTFPENKRKVIEKLLYLRKIFLNKLSIKIIFYVLLFKFFDTPFYAFFSP